MQEDKAVRAPATSFIVRLWTDDDGVPQMRGEIEHIKTGERRFFLNYWSMLNMLESWRRDAEPAT